MFIFHISVELFSIYSEGYHGVVGEERIQCNVTGNTTITRDTLSTAFLVIAEQLSGIVIADSSDISGKYIIPVVCNDGVLCCFPYSKWCPQWYEVYNTDLVLNIFYFNKQ